MPPLKRRSTGAFSKAEITAAGVSASASVQSSSRAWGERGIDFAVRGHTPPPAEMSDRS